MVQTRIIPAWTTYVCIHWQLTSVGSCSASFSIFSMFLVIATFCCALRGYEILFGIGPPYTSTKHMTVNTKVEEKTRRGNEREE